ncbi:MAG: phenylalanine--tRNA ligase subunit beta [Opitutales bacterium]|nr:phenylalanine--tRNA ligase subunit beta [Opitutales bacterium]MBP3358581.1 phenylalanine--tRNA ligase subunit beta [Opitutales bacterium]
MKVSLKWLNKYVDLSDVSVEQIADALPMLGLEVESVETTGMKQLNNVVVGEILSRDPHPNADKLGVCMVKVNPDADPVQIVCGAKNYKVGDRVPVALDGAKLPTADGGIFEIKVSQLRGVTSNGMMCSARELGMGTDHSGLLILEMRPEIGTPINDVFTESDTVFEIELTANRGDCLSHIGVARELAAKFGKKLKKPELKYNPIYTDKPTGNLVESIESQTSNCPLYTAVSIKGVKIAPSPEWLRRDIESVGLRSINNVVDVTNYVLMEYGQPLHSFDASKIRGKKIVVRQAQDGEEIQTLDEKKYTLTSEATLICDGEGAVALAGVMGGLNSEVSADTTDVVLESAWFNPGNVRATSRKYAINTDSSYRFARDVDPQGTLEASRRAVDLILETAGGEVVAETCKIGDLPRGDRDIDISLSYIIDRLGFDVSQEDVVNAFEALGFPVSDMGNGNMKVKVPSFRSEVDRPIDLVEEFVRIFGTDKIPETDITGTALLRDDDAMFRYNRTVADFLASRGLNECQNYSLKDSAELEKVHENIEALKLDNPLTSDQNCLRPSLLDSLLDVVRLNISNGNDFFGFFENGKIFRADNKGEICELASTAFVIAPDPAKRSWKKREGVDFFTAKEMAFDILSILGVDASRLNFTPAQEALWQADFSAGCGSEKREGFVIRFGAISVAHLRERGIERVVYAGEIMFKPEVSARKKTVEKFKPFSSFPTASRDIAVIAKLDEKASDVAFEIQKASKQKLKGADFDVESVELFDSYSGKGVDEGCKSLAFELKFRSNERTLQTEEVNNVFDAICQELGKKRKLRIS